MRPQDGLQDAGVLDGQNEDSQKVKEASSCAAGGGQTQSLSSMRAVAVQPPSVPTCGQMREI